MSTTTYKLKREHVNRIIEQAIKESRLDDERADLVRIYVKGHTRFSVGSAYRSPETMCPGMGAGILNDSPWERCAKAFAYIWDDIASNAWTGERHLRPAMLEVED